MRIAAIIFWITNIFIDKTYKNLLILNVLTEEHSVEWKNVALSHLDKLVCEDFACYFWIQNFVKQELFCSNVNKMKTPERWEIL